jgi:beta-glucosidase
MRHHIFGRAVRVFFLSFLLVAICLPLAVTAGSPARNSSTPAYLNPKLTIDERVADLMKRMTLEEKVGQVGSVGAGDLNNDGIDTAGSFDPDKAKRLLRNGIGEIAGPSFGDTADVPDENGYVPTRKTARQMAEFTNAAQRWVIENTRLHIPVMFTEESLHGFTAREATSFPQAIGLASTWDPELIQQAFTVAAREVRSRGAHPVLAPVLDISRDPRWGRTEETYGEDPFLASRIGLAAVRGLQGEAPAIDSQHVLATAKHFAGHGQPESGINTAPANISERTLRDHLLYPFEVAVRQGHIRAVMPSYNDIDGVPSHGNKWLLQGVLRDQWGFDGLVISDLRGISDLQTRHYVAADLAGAARLALSSGVDIELAEFNAYSTLTEQVKKGTVPVAFLDKAVARVLRAKFELGLFENPYVDVARAEGIARNPASAALALQVAREAIVLLKNEHNLLPLQRTAIKRIAVIGPNAGVPPQGGYSAVPLYRTSVLDGIRAKVGPAVEVLYAEGVRITKDTPSWYRDNVVLPDPAEDKKGIQQAAEIAASSDVAIVALGENEEVTREGWSERHLGDRPTLDLVGAQDELVRAVLAAGKPVVVILLNGKPLSVNYIAENAPAIIEGFYLGQETGTAIADVLFGDYNPSGRLPMTFPRSAGQLPAYYYYKPGAKRGFLFSDVRPLFPFGFGLSYTTFKYGKPQVSPAQIPATGKVVVALDVTNTGTRVGDEVVQLYVRDQVSSVTRPVKLLKGFQRVHAQPKETVNVRFTLTPEDLAFWDRCMRRVVEPGRFEIMIGPNSEQGEIAHFEVSGPTHELERASARNSTIYGCSGK